MPLDLPPLHDLPFLDEHGTTVAAPPAVVWDALLATLHGTFAAPTAAMVARLLAEVRRAAESAPS